MLAVQCVPKKVPFRNHSIVVKRALLCLWEFLCASKIAKRTATQCTQRIIDEFNALRQQPEMIRNAVRHMYKRTILCVDRSFKFHSNKQTIIYLYNRFWKLFR